MRGRARLAGLAVLSSTLVAASGLPAGARPVPATLRSASTSLSGQLFAVSADSASDAWAVGRLPGQPSQVVLHWDGTSWSPVPIPVTGAELFGVSAVSATNAWAVGVNNSGPVVLHWNGSTWAATSAIEGNVFPEAVSADSATDAWIVGTGDGEAHTFAWHWKGSAWTQVPAPSPDSGLNALFGVSARSPSDAWAVGFGGNNGKTLAMHWNGTSWTVVFTPNPGHISDGLSGVSAISASDAWAVGSFENPKTSRDDTLTLHWDGSAWHHVFAPSPGSTSNDVRAVSATSATDVWAAGTYINSTGGRRTLSLHWNGTSWRHVPTPNPAANDFLRGVSAVSATDAWAVGYASSRTGQQPLILHWNGTAWRQVPA